MDCPMSIPVFYGKTEIATLRVERVGLYYEFLCQCHVRAERILRIYAVEGRKIKPLGILMPQKDIFELRQRVSVRTWDFGNIDFAVCGYCPQANVLPWRGEVDGVTVDGWLEDGSCLWLRDDAEFPLPASRKDAEERMVGGEMFAVLKAI